MGQKFWYYENCPNVHFDFAEALLLSHNVIDSVKVCKRSPFDVMQSESKRYHSEVYMSDFESYGPELEDGDYSPHSIQAIFKDALQPDETTPDRTTTRELFTGVVYGGNTSDDGFTPLNSLDLKILKTTDAASLLEEEKLELDRLLCDHEPITSPPYRLSFPKTLELKAEIDKMLTMRVVEDCRNETVVCVSVRITGS
ncbi:PREDICTED: uncharacterized protein LOC108373046 [Rhagoletis zephyria]|uniref:uncharacterized protein LOC108373046 n=1 Tax=Rhagoletis zephyria TaxID=28612 RepID=UPI000811684B|nr:PREDICTED: uncharacterized protein LOC108373046 [Rhagoletis zephyria]